MPCNWPKKRLAASNRLNDIGSNWTAISYYLYEYLTQCFLSLTFQYFCPDHATKSHVCCVVSVAVYTVITRVIRTIIWTLFHNITNVYFVNNRENCYLSWTKLNIAYVNGVVRKVCNSYPNRQNGRHFADDIFRCNFVNEKFCIWLKFH